MPTYNYYCKVCEVVREVAHSLADGTQKLCMVCFTPMDRRPSVAAIKFNGSGFYSTDN